MIVPTATTGARRVLALAKAWLIEDGRGRWLRRGSVARVRPGDLSPHLLRDIGLGDAFVPQRRRP